MVRWSGLLLLAWWPALAATVVVSPSGNDTAPGTAAAPLASLQGALDRAGPGGEVLLATGTWYLRQPLTITAALSGTAAQPTRLQAAPGAKPRLVGGAKLTGWRPFKDAIVRCELAPLGLAGAVFRELYADGRRLTLARYPNADPLDPIGGGWLYAAEAVTPASARAFIAGPQDLPPFEDLRGVEVFQFHDVNYYNTVVPLEAIDRATRRVTLGADTYGPIRGAGAERYFYQNCLAALDAPGEWFLDRTASVVYLYPPRPVEQLEITAPLVDHLVQVQAGTQHVAIRGLRLEAARSTAVRLDSATQCRVVGCTVQGVGVGTQIGGWGPWEDCCGIGVFGGSSNQVLGNDISQTGGHGVKLVGGNRATLQPGGHLAANNHIHHTGLDWKQGCGARLEGCGNRFERNDVHDIPRMGVIFGGNDQVIAGNHLWRLNLETCDTGAIYTGGRDAVTPWGSQIVDNVIHDVLGFGREHGRWGSPTFSWGIYLDDLASGVTVRGNLVLGCLRGGVHIHSGRYNRIENNYLLDGAQQQIEFNGWTDQHPYWNGQVTTRQQNWEARRALPSWAQRYPELFSAPPSAWPPLVMSGNRVERNVLASRVEGARIYRCNSLPLDRTTFDHNLLWLGGRAIRTGLAAPVVEVVGDQELCPQGDFEAGAPGDLPAGWSWYARPSQACQASALPGAGREGSQAVGIVCAPPDQPNGQFTFAMLKSSDLPIRPGQGYRLAAWFRADRAELPVTLVAQSYGAGKYHWAREVGGRIGPAWKLLELAFVTPAADEPEAQAGMRTLYVRLDCRAAAGTVWVDQVSLREAKTLDEWTAWQRNGLDRNSLVADPQFVDPAAGDWRLQATSPASGLGIAPLAVDRIGCYAAPERATWPLQGVPLPRVLQTGR